MPLFIEYPVNKDTLKMAGWTVVGDQALIELLGKTFHYHLKNKTILFMDSTPEPKDWFYEDYMMDDPLGLVLSAHEEQGRIRGLKPYMEWHEQLHNLVGHEVSICNILQDSKVGVIWSLGFSPVRTAIYWKNDIETFNYLGRQRMFSGEFFSDDGVTIQ